VRVVPIQELRNPAPLQVIVYDLTPDARHTNEDAWNEDGLLLGAKGRDASRTRLLFHSID
jgi:hypothetical protein